MAVMMAGESWTDERLDDLNVKVDEGFARVDRRFEQVDQRFEQVDRRFEQVDRRFETVEGELREFRIEANRRFERVNEEFVAVRREMKEGFESQHRLMVQGIIGICASIMAGFSAVVGVIAATI